MMKSPASDSHVEPTAPRRGIALLLLSLAIVEIVSFSAITMRGTEFFHRFTWEADTGSYTRVAEALAQGNRLIASPRTLGYPLFLTPIYHLFGGDRAPFVAVAVQLALNLVLAYGGWHLMARVVPQIGSGLILTMTAILGWAGMGLAFRMLTDLLGGLAFFGFLYGLLYCRRPVGIAVCATSLFVATLLRPTLTFLPLLIPIVAYLIGRTTSRVPMRVTCVVIAGGFAATCINVAYQYRNYGYWGPSPVVSMGLRATLMQALGPGDERTKEAWKSSLDSEVERRAGRSIDAISVSEEEQITKAIFREHVQLHPWAIVRGLLISAVKYTFAPIEAFVLHWIHTATPNSAHAGLVRAILIALWIPLWVLALFPPLGASRGFLFYWLTVIVLLAYMVGLSAMHPWQGERFRFPLLAFMLPIVAQNLIDLHRRFRAWRTRDRA